MSVNCVRVLDIGKMARHKLGHIDIDIFREALSTGYFSNVQKYLGLRLFTENLIMPVAGPDLLNSV